MSALLFFIAGLVLLLIGAAFLVEGASHLAGRLGISRLAIGLTVVAFGTSAPELAVSVQSALINQGDISLGNIVGSNIFNILFILGLAALITPLSVDSQLIRLDVPLMIGASLLVYFFARNGVIESSEGMILFGGIIAYTAFQFIRSRREKLSGIAEDLRDAPAADGKGLRSNILAIAAGLAMLVIGAHLLVTGATYLARLYGISELVIGLTIVSIGTSLPELATSVVASIRGERDIAVGNVIGSNVFNLLAVLGLASMVSPMGMSVSTGVLGFDLPVMVGVSLACLPVFITGAVISRREGGLFLALYLIYVTCLLIAARQDILLPDFSREMPWLILPLTLIMLILSALISRHR